MGPEAKIEEKIWKAAEKMGWWQAKIVFVGLRGAPDRLFIRGGRIVFIEVKAQGEEPTEQQGLRHDELRAAGAEVHWVDNLEDALVILS